MKKSDKIFLCTVGSIFVVGLAFVTAGLMFGGWTEAAEIVKKYDITPRVISTTKNIYTPKAELTQTSTSTVAVTKVMNLDISLGNGEVTIKTGNTSDVSFAGSSGVKYEEKDNTIIVSGKTGDVTLIIPEDLVFDKANITIGAAELTADRLICNDMDLDIGAGEANIQNLEVKNTADLKIGAGDLTITKASLRDSDIDLGLGNIDYYGNISGNLKLKCGMGNATLNLNDSKESHSISTTCSMGNINIDGSNNFSIGGSQEIIGSTDSKYNIECGMGNVDIYFNK